MSQVTLLFIDCFPSLQQNANISKSSDGKGLRVFLNILFVDLNISMPSDIFFNSFISSLNDSLEVLKSSKSFFF